MRRGSGVSGWSDRPMERARPRTFSSVVASAAAMRGGAATPQLRQTNACRRSGKCGSSMAGPGVAGGGASWAEVERTQRRTVSVKAVRIGKVCQITKDLPNDVDFLAHIVYT